MRIGLFGNTGNSLFYLAESFRTLGEEVVLVVTSKELGNRPESVDSAYSSCYPSWMIDAADLAEVDYFKLTDKVTPILSLLHDCDALILNDVGPSLLVALDRPAIAFLTGSDLDYYANPIMTEARTACWGKDYRESPDGQNEKRTMHTFIERQRWGIQHAVAVRYFPRGVVPVGDRLLDELGVTNDRRIFVPTASAHVKVSPAPRNWPIRVFCATRLTWKLPIEPGRSSLDYKGSDVMIRGLALFHRTTGTRLDIQLVRKGLHVEELVSLIAEEGLADQVNWSDEMSLSDVWSRYAESDIMIEQLADSTIGGAGLDALATGRPVIGNAHNGIFDGLSMEQVPICQAKTAEEVCEQLRRLVFDPAERERVGEAGRRYVEQHCSIWHLARMCVERLEQALSTRRRSGALNATSVVLD